jgi:two-component sensor histidine kinase
MGRTARFISAALLAVTFSGFVSRDIYAQGAEAPPRVLVIHSYGTDFQWTRDMDAAIRATLQADPFDYAAVFSEYLDAKYHTSDEYFAARAEMLAVKYAGWSFDAIIVTDNLALEFVKRYRDGLFVRFRTVFAGINDYMPAMTEGLSAVTGVPEQVSAAETLDLALELFPGGRLFVIGDGTLTSRINLGTLERALLRYQDPPVMDARIAIGESEVVELAAEIQAGDIVILIGSILEDDGTVADFWRAGSIVSEIIPVPVFVFWDFFIGTGVAGGFVASGREQGVAAARLAERILAGEDVETIPVAALSPNRWVFDMGPLEEAGIGRRQLPRDAVLLNQRISVWETYRYEIITLALILTSMGVLISLLFINIKRRALVAARLRESLSEKEVLLKEIHHRVKNNLQVISSILSIQSSFIADRQSLDYFRDCETRVQSMALVHEQLYQTDTFARIQISTYLGELISSLYSAMTVPSGRVTISQEVEDLSLHLDQAIPVGLVVNELLSNALKYAYPPGGTGEIALRVEYLSGQAIIDVRDWGVGMDPEAPHSESLGLQLVEALAKQLRGEVRFSRAEPGLEVRFAFPVAETA